MHAADQLPADRDGRDEEGVGDGSPSGHGTNQGDDGSQLPRDESQMEGHDVDKAGDGPHNGLPAAQEESQMPVNGRDVDKAGDAPHNGLPAAQESQMPVDGRHTDGGEEEGRDVDKASEGPHNAGGLPAAQEESQMPVDGRHTDGGEEDGRDVDKASEGPHSNGLPAAQEESQMPVDGHHTDGDEESHKTQTGLRGVDEAFESNQEKRQRDVDEESDRMNGRIQGEIATCLAYPR